MKKIETTLFHIPCKIKGICNVFLTVARLNITKSNIQQHPRINGTTVHSTGLFSLKLGGNFKHPKKDTPQKVEVAT